MKLDYLDFYKIVLFIRIFFIYSIILVSKICNKTYCNYIMKQTFAYKDVYSSQTAKS